MTMAGCKAADLKARTQKRGRGRLGSHYPFQGCAHNDLRLYLLKVPPPLNSIKLRTQP
jgi:hypothetical protein